MRDYAADDDQDILRSFRAQGLYQCRHQRFMPGGLATGADDVDVVFDGLAVPELLRIIRKIKTYWHFFDSVNITRVVVFIFELFVRQTYDFVCIVIKRICRVGRS